MQHSIKVAHNCGLSDTLPNGKQWKCIHLRKAIQKAYEKQNTTKEGNEWMGVLETYEFV